MDHFLGEIRLFSWTVIPKGWLPCHGQILQSKDYPALHSLLGKQFGGDGRYTFGVPDLRGRVAIGINAKMTDQPRRGVHGLGELGGSETVMLPPAALVPHTHSVQVSSSSMNNGGPSNYFPAVHCNTNSQPAQPTYVQAEPEQLVALHPETVTVSPQVQTAVDNMQPSLCLSYCIATQGAYPMRDYSTTPDTKGKP